MLNGTFFICLCLCLYSADSAMRCKWMDHKFRQYSKNSLDLLDTMAHNSTNSTEVDETVDFPEHLYIQASNASGEDRLAFTVQVLREVADLFEEDSSSASWEEKQVDDFLNIVTQQADGLHSCIASHSHNHSHSHKKNKKLHMYFKRLSRHVLKHMDYSAESWELVRKEIQNHLNRSDLLISSLLK